MGNMGVDCQMQDKKYVSIIKQIDTILNNTEGLINKGHNFTTKEVDRLNEKFDEKLKPQLLINLTNYDYKLATIIEIFGLIAIIGVAVF